MRSGRPYFQVATCVGKESIITADSDILAVDCNHVHTQEPVLTDIRNVLTLHVLALWTYL